MRLVALISVLVPALFAHADLPSNQEVTQVDPAASSALVRLRAAALDYQDNPGPKTVEALRHALGAAQTRKVFSFLGRPEKLTEENLKNFSRRLQMAANCDVVALKADGTIYKSSIWTGSPTEAQLQKWAKSLGCVRAVITGPALIGGDNGLKVSPAGQ